MAILYLFPCRFLGSVLHAGHPAGRRRLSARVAAAAAADTARPVRGHERWLRQQRHGLAAASQAQLPAELQAAGGGRSTGAARLTGRPGAGQAHQGDQHKATHVDTQVE